jgi:UDP:flavonoid glycosyltransferase YjiC (YdhE family)
MHALIVPFGSHGDVHPLLGLGIALRERGYRVAFVSHRYFDPLIHDHGFESAAFGDADEFRAVMNDPGLWKPREGFAVVARGVVQSLRPIHDAIASLVTSPAETVIVGGSLAFAARVAQDSLRLPGATVHLQPGLIPSVYDTPVFPGLDTRRWPRWVKRPFFRWVFKTMLDPHVAPGINAFRAELGLPPVSRLMDRWINSPDLVLGLFPAWYAPPQPDWPPQMKLCGFPLYDERESTPLPPDLDAFLCCGPPPIAFTPGSANVQGRDFFQRSIDACRLLGARGVLLTRHREQLPRPMPDGIFHSPFAPFSHLLPRVSALVHHGGIGTASQALAAGIPQLIMPLAHDQYDNASRLARLGVSRTVLPTNYRGPSVSQALDSLLSSPTVSARCSELANLCQADSGPPALRLACEHLEALISAGSLGR